jgi:hypothetical protein
MYAEPQSYGSWSNYDQSMQPSQDEVVALLNDYSHSQSGSSAGINSFIGMFGDWVAIGYDGGPIPILDPPLHV